MSFLEMQVTTKSPDVAAAADAAMDSALHDMEREILVSLVSPKHGRAYQRADGVHHASAPGEPPASDSGELMDSIKVERFGAVGYVTANTEYADYLEHGTHNMLPRPFMGPAWRAAVARHAKYETLFATRLEASV